MNNNRRTQASKSLGAAHRQWGGDSVVPVDINAFFRMLKPLLRNGIDVDIPVQRNNFTLLHIAALQERRDAVALLLANRATVDVVTLDGCTPLHIACEKGFGDVVKILLVNQASVDAVTRDGWTPLHLAAQCGAVDILADLLARQANVDAVTNGDHATPLFIAAQHGHADVVKMLLKHHANVDAVTEAGDSPLHIACDRGYLGIVSALLACDANADSPSDAGDTPLYIAAAQDHADVVSKLLAHRTNRASVDDAKAIVFAAQQGYADVVSALLAAQVDVNSTYERGSTALHMAAQQGHTGVVTLLLANQATVDATNVDGRTPLHGAAQQGHADVVSVLLSSQANVVFRDEDGITPLHLAAHVDVVIALLAKNANVNAVGKNGATPLFLSAGEGRTDVVTALLAADATIDAADMDGWTPLHMAAKNGRVDAVSVLLASRASVDAADMNGSTPLYLAVMEGHVEVVSALIASQANVDAAAANGFTPLHFASLSGRVNIVDILLRSQAKVDAVDASGATPLFCAVASGETSVVNLLLSHQAGGDTESPLHTSTQDGREATIPPTPTKKAYVNGTNEIGWTPLHLAARRGDAIMVTTLLANGAYVDAVTVDNMGTTSLHFAATFGHEEVASALLAAQASVNATAPDGATPLHCAARNGRTSVLFVLLANGASVEAATADGSTPLHVAARAGSLDVLSVLLDKQVRVDGPDAKGATPLHHAAKNGHVNVVSELLVKGANAAATAINGLTPLHIAAQNGCVEVVDFLLAKMANRGPSSLGVRSTRNAECSSELVTSPPNVGTTSKHSNLTSRSTLPDEHLKIADQLPNPCAHYLQSMDTEGNTPILAAARSGHFDVVEAFIEAGASVSDRAADGETVLISAARRRNLSAVSMLSDLGCLTSRGTGDNEQQSLVTLTLQTLRDYAWQTQEFRVIWLRMVDRLLDVYERLQEARDSHREIVLQFAMVTVQVIQLKPACSGSSIFARLVASSSTAARFRDLHTELTFVERLVSFESTDSELNSWATQCTRDEVALVKLFREKIDGDASLNWSLLEEEDRVEAASLLQHTVRFHGDKCSPDLLDLLELSLSKVLDVANVTAPSIPAWFIPPHELGFHVMENGSDIITAGSSLDLALSSGTWSNTSATVNLYWMQQEDFIDTVERCLSLAHPNVVKVYGASHLFRPFIAAFESDSSTNLREYLASDEKNLETWQRLYEVSRGLEYLLGRGIIFTNLRCEYIWVGRDGVAKINAFDGCVASHTRTRVKHVRWQAPEHIRGGAVSVASNIFSFGMCILEALTGKIPGEGIGDGFVASEILGGFRPPLPEGMTEEQRRLLERMWLTDSLRRPSISEVVQHLKQFAEEQQRESHGRENTDKLQAGSAWVNFDSFVFPELRSTVNDFLKELETKCNYCRESTEAVLHIFQRLRDVYDLLQMQHKTTRDVALVSFCELLVSFDRFLGTAMREKSVLERAKSQKVSLRSHEHHKLLDELLELLAPPTIDPIHQWRSQAAVLGECADTEVGPDIPSTPVASAPVNENVTIVRFETEKLNQCFKKIDLEKIDAAAVAAIDESAKATRPEWLIPANELKYNRREHMIGTGAFGEVYRATWRGTPVVVKYMGYEVDGGTFRREMFAHELRVWFPLSSPYVIKLFGACPVGKLSFVCEFAGNGTLKEYLKRDAKNTDKSWELMHQVALGLKYLHEQDIVHNDLKCNNVLVGSDGIAKITDFGLSCILNSAEVKVNPAKQGASQWKSPEYIRGDRVTLKSDIYSFGMCILEAMTGEVPWVAANDATVPFRVKKGALPLKPACLSDAQWTLVRMMCATEPSRRVGISFVIDKLDEFAQQQELLVSRRKEAGVADHLGAP